LIASTSPDLCRKESSIVYWKVEDSGKNAEDEAPDRMLPWVIDLLKRLPRRLRSDGEEFVFLTPEGKPVTDTWWPKRGAGRRPVDDESKGIWFRCLRSLGIRPRKFYTTRHTFIAWALSEGANLKGLADWLRACHRFKIPEPPRHLWAKAQRQKPRRPRLPDLPPGEAVEIVIRLPN
jgi:hypothetical protein